jgi:hypothetical protein
MRNDIMNALDTMFIYALQRQPDGTWVAVNRQYKPIGFTTREGENYADYPIAHKFKRMTPAFRKSISWDGNGGDDTTIYMYTAYNHPLKSVENMQSYLHRLSILMRRALA